MPFIIRNKNNTPHKLNVKNAEIQVSVIIVSFMLKSSVKSKVQLIIIVFFLLF